MRRPFGSDRLEGEVAFVAGGGSGICEGIARAYMAHGARKSPVAARAVVDATCCARRRGPQKPQNCGGPSTRTSASVHSTMASAASTSAHASAPS